MRGGATSWRPTVQVSHENEIEALGRRWTEANHQGLRWPGGRRRTPRHSVAAAGHGAGPSTNTSTSLLNWLTQACTYWNMLQPGSAAVAAAAAATWGTMLAATGHRVPLWRPQRPVPLPVFLAVAALEASCEHGYVHGRPLPPGPDTRRVVSVVKAAAAERRQRSEPPHAPE